MLDTSHNSLKHDTNIDVAEAGPEDLSWELIRRLVADIEDGCGLTILGREIWN
jgi:hypothetical protein